MDIDIHPSWQNILQSELKAPYFRGLMEFVAQEYATYRCYPREDRIFAALDHCPWEKTKVVIIGQDPYHGPGQIGRASLGKECGSGGPAARHRNIDTDV